MNNPIVIAAFISFLGTIIAALIPYIIKWPKKKIIYFGLIGWFIGMIIGFKIVAPYIIKIKPIDDCCSARIISPKGTKNQLDAKAFLIQNRTKLSWFPDDCVMTVQYYQDNYLFKEYKNVISGSEINIDELDLGKTEIKIWREGSKKPADYIWVWVKDNIPTKQHIRQPKTIVEQKKPEVLQKKEKESEWEINEMHGAWEISWYCNDQRHEGTLVMRGRYGRMTIRFSVFSPITGDVFDDYVDQDMELLYRDKRAILVGSNPTIANTTIPNFDYEPDIFILDSQHSDSIQIVRFCHPSGECHPVTSTFIGGYY